tara:strand:- start:627 stop:773 length:147 start_codon:yes stop_codon:yes gene_type:complete
MSGVGVAMEAGREEEAVNITTSPTTLAMKAGREEEEAVGSISPPRRLL